MEKTGPFLNSQSSILTVKPRLIKKKKKKNEAVKATCSQEENEGKTLYHMKESWPVPRYHKLLPSEVRALLHLKMKTASYLSVPKLPGKVTQEAFGSSTGPFSGESSDQV